MLIAFINMHRPVNQDASLIDERFVAAIIQVESGGDPLAESEAGARGLMQIMPETWADMTKRPWRDAFNADANKEVGTKYLKWIETTLTKWGYHPTYDAIAACYVGGIGHYDNMKGSIPDMGSYVMNYVEKVQKAMNKWPESD